MERLDMSRSAVLARRGGVPPASRLVLSLALVATSLAVGCEAGEDDTPVEVVDYASLVQPILAEHCFACHGAATSAAGAGLQLDTYEHATTIRANGRAIVPGDPDASLVIQRTHDATSASRMPPVPNEALTADEVDTLRRWIRGGAQYETHWSFLVPTRPDVPAYGYANAVDDFVAERLAAEGVTASPAADAGTLVRRLYLDLTGLPPTIEQLEAFEADPSEDAYLALVDTLLASDAHAEHLARDWLDYAGYGDSNGLYVDDVRTSFPYRDWVITAFRANTPLDTFVIAQLAGDLLPSATDDDRLATAFLRLHPTTAEGGVDDEEFRLQYALNRAQAVGNQLLGLTVQCAQCHDHKYDPIQQREVYALMDCFHHVGDVGLVLSASDERPLLTTTPTLGDERATELDLRIATLEAGLASASVETARARWEATLAASARWYRPTLASASSSLGADAYVSGAGTVEVTGTAPYVDTIEVRFDADDAITAIRLAASAPTSVYAISVSELTLDVLASDGRHRVPLVAAFTEDGTALPTLVDGRTDAHVELTEGDALTLVLAGPVEAGSSLRLRVDERRGYQTGAGHLELWTSPSPSAVLDASDAALVATAASARTEAEAARLRELFALVAPAASLPASPLGSSSLRDDALELVRSRAERDERRTSVATRVYAEDDPSHATYVQLGGVYGANGDRVACDLPRSITGTSPPSIDNRLDLARWIMGADNPLTARVLANHYVALALGQPLMTTPEDWGARGATPELATLLDWLAVELRESGWDLRAFLRLLVTSETYRRSSTIREDLAELDPSNLLFARGARRRLDAEVIRDRALVASGLLVDVAGGTPVFPYHPEGLYEAINDAYGSLTTYRPDRDPSRIHRRALYTLYRRGTLLPSMSLFDAPTRMRPVARRDETSTPTQALALWNDTLFVEAARALAIRARVETASDDERSRIATLVELALVRSATEDELTLLEDAYEAELADLDDASARALLDLGESDWSAPEGLRELAARTMVARVVLSSSELVTRE